MKCSTRVTVRGKFIPVAATIIALAVACPVSPPAPIVKTYSDDFSSYSGACMDPPSSGVYTANWDAEGTYVPGVDHGPWHIGGDSLYAPAFGQYAETWGLPSGANPRWLTFTVNETGTITEATLQFDYLVQTNATLAISISPTDGFTDLVPVPFTFVQRFNSGQIEDSTGSIDLTPYLSSSATLVVRFDSVGTGSTASLIRLDNFSLSTTSAP
jgi:hypothetical protein